MKQILMQVTAHSTYLPEQSSQEKQRFLWSYEITVVNNSEHAVQLLNRHWRIADMTGRVEEVRGPGVVGLQPIIKPGKSFTYNSFCQLITPQGTMEGNYEVQVIEDEVKFLVQIPKFLLATPAAISMPMGSQLH